MLSRQDGEYSGPSHSDNMDCRVRKHPYLSYRRPVTEPCSGRTVTNRLVKVFKPYSACLDCFDKFGPIG